MSARTVVLLAAVSFAAPALAYQQTKGSTGIGLHWATPSVSWFLSTCRPANSPSCQGDSSSDPAEAAVRAAFEAWETATRVGDTAPCSGLALPYAGRTTSVEAGTGDAQHLIVFRQGWCSSNPDAVADPCYSKGTCSNLYNCFDDTHGGMSRDVLALTTVRYTLSTGIIGDADMEIVNWGGLPGALGSEPADGWYWTCFDPSASNPTCSSYGQAGCVYMDLQNTVTHEAGHFIGLAHPCEAVQALATTNGVPVCSGGAMAETTMYPSASVREISKRTLAPDDVEGVCTIYPRGATSAVSAAATRETSSAVSTADAYVCVPRPTRGKTSGGCGAGSATPAGLIVLAVAIAALLPRRRRARC